MTTGPAALPGPLSDLADVDEVALVAVRTLLEMDGVVRSGIALRVAGGRQLRFLPSDPERLTATPDWCLIDAYDRLPLNDAVRTGRSVVHRDAESVLRDYPDLATHQAGEDVEGVVAVPVLPGGERLGGLLAYSTQRLSGPRDDLVRCAEELAAGVAQALGVVRRTTREWPEDLTPGAGFDLPADDTAPSMARRHLEELLADLGVADEAVVHAALVCASELVTNVVMHTGRPSVMSVDVAHGRLTVRIQHPTGPPVASVVAPVEPEDEPDPLRVSGHGLELVEALSAAWGAAEDADVATAWFALEV